jgi:hypothetical protein
MHAAGLTHPEEFVAGPNPQTDFGAPSAIGHKGGT